METKVELEAGKELDAVIAEKVMGWKTFKANRELLFTDPKDARRGIRVPEFSTYIGAAWQIVEKMRERRIYIDVETLADGYRATAGREGPPNGDIWEQFFARSTSAPHAICLAALDAVASTSTGN